MGAPSSLDGDNSGFLPVLSNCSIQAYQKYTGNEMLVVCGVEVGPTNSIVPMYAAATITANGGTCFVLDGDLQGRAVLSLTMLGPYMFNGVNMSGTFYSYVLPLGAPVPAGVLSQENVVISGNTYTVVGMRVPDSSSSPADTEAFLGNVIQNAAPNTVITVVFGGLNARLLRANTVQYTPGVYTQICTPNTISRSVAMGRSIIDQDFKPILKSLTQQNANIVSEDGYLNAFQGAGGGTRSDIAVWSVETESGNIYNGFYNNETVLLTYGSKDFKHLFTTPNTIGIMSLTEFSQDGVNIYLGECLTNDEIASYFTAIPYLKIPVLLFQLPAANLLLNDEALNWITPNKWGLANQFPAPYPSLTDIPFISCPSIYVAPSYPKYFAINPNYRFTELKIVTNDEENSPTEDKPIEDDNTPKDINTKKKSGCCTIM